jgi:hypothetical protein
MLRATEDVMSPCFRVLALAALSVAGCNSPRNKECDKFLGVIKPLDQGTPTADMVDRVHKDLGAIPLQDEPLKVYSKNYQDKLTVLSSTLALKAGGSPPDGTDAVIKQNLKAVRTDRDDVQRYCSQ